MESKMEVLGEEEMKAKKAKKAKMPDEDVKVSRPESEGDKEMDKMKMDKMKMDKAEVVEADLLKSLEKIEAITKSETPEARKQDLLQKSLDGNASEEEQVELASLLKGEPLVDAEEDFSKSLEAEEEGALAKAIDVSDALGELVGKLEKALGTVGEELRKSSSHQGEVNLVLAKGLLDTSRLALTTNGLVKSLQSTLEDVLRQPAGGRRSVAGHGQVIQKSHAGTAPADEQITKGQILDLLDAMIEERVVKGEALVAPCGEDLTKATAKVETSGGISPALMQDIADFRRQRQSV